MGGAFSTRNFQRRTDIEGQGKDVLLHAKAMHMTNYHLDRLFYEFNKLAGESGTSTITTITINTTIIIFIIYINNTTTSPS